MKKLLFLSIICLFIAGGASSQDRMSLGGEWNFALDPDRKGTPPDRFDKRITLPGTTDQAGYGTPSTVSDFGILTRAHKYYGLAWYSRRIDIPEQWAGRRIFVELERVMWQSKLYLDGREVSMQESLNSPHRHDLGMLSAGPHNITISIDNDQIYNIGDKGHLYTEYTQSIWNGAVGAIEIYAKPTVRLTNPQIYTHISPRSITIRDTITVEKGTKKHITLGATLLDGRTRELVWHHTTTQSDPIVDINETLPDGIKLWDDVNPNLYELTITLSDNRGTELDRTTHEIGFREVASLGTRLLVNNRPVFLRGNLDCVHFPLTGYPSCDVGDWERIFRIYKEYGLNHVRFHSWTPPAAAFTAANRVGIYVQSEVLWLDWWMAVDQPDRPEMFTRGLPKGLGYNPSADTFAKDEMRRMVQNYGNNPSLVMMCIGNELGNSNFDSMEVWIKSYRDRDPRRLYAASVARRINPSDQYLATHNIDGLGATRGLRGGASLDWDFEDVYSRATLPVIAHEIGQWPVYPLWSQIKKYKGTLRAMNLEEFAAQARKNGIYDQNEDFAQASGALSQIMYKYEIESFLRTPSCSGIQLLGMQDYQGQGEALIGWLDVFYDSKGITTPGEFRHHHDSIVPLLRLPRFVWRTNETLDADIQLAQWGTTTLTDAIEWRVQDPNHNTIASGTIPSHSYERATSQIAGRMNCALGDITKAQKLKITLSLAHHDIQNSWYVWVYPTAATSTISATASSTASAVSAAVGAQPRRSGDAIYQTRRFDKQTIERLARGESVLLDASELGTPATADAMSFYPLYWSLTFFPGQGKNTIGLVVQDRHPVFGDFPTDSHSDWQWQSIYEGAKGFYINGFPSNYRPMAQPVDDFHRNNFMAAIFELKVGAGRLLVSGFNLQDSNNVVAAQLRRSMLAYMDSESFAPTHEVALPQLTSMFHYDEPRPSEIPTEFAGAILYVESGANQADNGNHTWNMAQDRASLLQGCSYNVTCDGTWRDGALTAWHGRQIEMTIECPKGFIGTLHLFFHDWNDQSRQADITFEGRDYKLGEHNKDGKWVKLHVMREDSNKGTLTLKVTSRKGGNVMLSKVALVADK